MCMCAKMKFSSKGLVAEFFHLYKISCYTEMFICIVYLPLQGHRALPILATVVSGRTHQYTGLVGV